MKMQDFGFIDLETEAPPKRIIDSYRDWFSGMPAIPVSTCGERLRRSKVTTKWWFCAISPSSPSANITWRPSSAPRT